MKRDGLALIVSPVIETLLIIVRGILSKVSLNSRGILRGVLWVIICGAFFSTIETMLQRSGIIVESLLKSRGSLRGVLRVITCRGGSFYN